MIDWVKSLLQPAGSAPGDQRLGAVAALLVEAATLDGRFDGAERGAILKILARHFGLDEAGAVSALNAAIVRQGEASDFFSVTRQITAAYAPQDRIAVVEALWEVILADGVVHAYEASLMRRLGGLIHVTDQELGAARQRVAARVARD